MEATKEENKDKTPLFLLFLASWDKLRWLGREEATVIVCFEPFVWLVVFR